LMKARKSARKVRARFMGSGVAARIAVRAS